MTNTMVTLWPPKSLQTWFRPFIAEPLVLDASIDKNKSEESFLLRLIVLATLSTIGALCQANSIPRGGEQWFTLSILATAVWVLTAFLLTILRPRTSSFVLAFPYLLLLTIHLFYILMRSTEGRNLPLILNVISATLAAVAFTIVVNMPLRDPLYDKRNISASFSVPTQDSRSPEDDITLWQWMSVSWMTPMIALGAQRQLNAKDVWDLGYEFQHAHLHEAFRTLAGGVVRRLLKANWIDVAILSALAIVELVANYSVPLLLQKLLEAMQNLRYETRHAVMYAGLMLVARLIAAQSSVFSLWFGRRCYERSRGEMITMLYEKTLNRKILSLDHEKFAETLPKSAILSPTETGSLNGDAANPQDMLKGNGLIRRAFYSIRSTFRLFSAHQDNSFVKKPTSTGKLLNLMKSDVYEVAQRFWEVQNLINRPIGLVLSIALTWRILGWPCLLGIAVVIIAQVFNAILSKLLISWEKVRRAATDARLQKSSEYIEAIRHLRWYAWHTTWLNDVMESREKELNLRIVTALITSLIMFSNLLANSLVPISAFWAYTALAGQELRVEIAFPALQVFFLVQDNLRDIPNLITMLLNAYVAVGRLEDFMNEPDKNDEAQSSQSQNNTLQLENACFSWPGVEATVLEDVSLAFSPGIHVIFGTVAAGKSALLQALLGELDLLSGQLHRSIQPVAYCAQSPWLQSMSIRDNILFFSPYDEGRYKKTLDACELLTDLAGFEHGDLSPIGENGIGLSGGQRARVALARAIYSSAATVMLDDPLSALDQATAESVVEKLVFGGLLKGRTVILVTHRTDLMAGVADQIIEIENGHATLKSADHLGSSGTLSSSQATKIGNDVNFKDGINPLKASAAIPSKFEEEEHRAHGGVQATVYWQYIKAGRLGVWAAIIAATFLVRLLLLTQTWFIKEWGEAYNRGEEELMILFAPNDDTAPAHMTWNLDNPLTKAFRRLPNPSEKVQPWLLAYLLLQVVTSVLDLGRSWLQLAAQYIAGRRIFKEIMQQLSNCTFRFYDVTPVGRLMNRLTSDIGTIDGNISNQFTMVAWHSIMWIASISVIATVTPLFLVLALLLSAAFVVVFYQFLPTSQSLRRLEMTALSPLMSNFGALVHGLTTVRAFCAQSRFQDTVIEVTDTFQRMDHFYWSVQAWMTYRFDWLSAVSTFLLTCVAIFSGLSPGLTAFVLSAADRFVLATHLLCRQFGELQLEFVSVERVIELLHIAQEPAGTIEPPAYWPGRDSDIVFENVGATYAPHLDPALVDVSVTLKGGTNTAIVGRTGSGKSTFALALLGTVPITRGTIRIGGVDISQVDKQVLRGRMTFLAQDPMLFAGTLRHNLDPTNEHSDTECMAVIDRVCSRYGWKLETVIDANGTNLSQGQRQLVGLARAILRRSSIIIMDEATASIDHDTAWEIQRVLREDLAGSTVVTIAHRAAAVRDADACLQLDRGRVARWGKPDEILVQDSGVVTSA